MKTNSTILKQVASFIFILAFFTQIFSRGLIIADYYSNKVAYAKDCINKARPALRCNGKCQMMKKMQEEEKKDKENEQRKSQNEILVLSSKSFFASFVLPNFPTIFISTLFPRKESIFSNYTLEIFHPPQL